MIVRDCCDSATSQDPESRFKVSVYHFFIILRVCSPKLPQGVIHGCFCNFSSQLRWLIKNRTTAFKLSHGAVLLLNWSCLVSSPWYIYYPGRRRAAATSARERSVVRSLHQILRKINAELVSPNIQSRNLIIIILFQRSTACIWNYIKKKILQNFSCQGCKR